MPYNEDENQYEIMPIHEINEMKKEIESLKKQYLDKGVSVSIDTLNNNVKDLLAVFKEATLEMREEQKIVDASKKKIDEVSSNVNELFDQNVKIAEGIIAMHDLSREMKEMMDKMVKKSAKPELATPMPNVPPLPSDVPPIPANIPPPLPSVVAEPEMPMAPPPLAPRPPQPPQGLGRPLPGTMLPPRMPPPSRMPPPQTPLPQTPPPQIPPPQIPPPQMPLPGSEDIGFLPPTPPPRRARAPPPPLGLPLPKKKKKGLFV